MKALVYSIYLCSLFLTAIPAGAQRPDTAQASHLLDSAIRLSHRADFRAAIQLGKRALDLRRRAFGDNHLAVAENDHLLGIFYWNLSQLDSAGTFLQRALRIRQQQLPPGHPDLGANLNDLGLILRERGQYEAALRNFRQALDIQLAALGPEHPNIADVYANMGIIHYQLGNWDQAENYFDQVLRLRLAASPQQREQLLAAYNNLGVLHWKRQSYTKALEYFQRVIALQQERYGRDHTTLATTYHNLALVYDEQGNDEQALAFNRRALAIRRTRLGEQHPEVARSCENIGILYRKQRQYTAAEDYLRRARNIRINTLGPAHPEVAYSNRQLGQLFAEREQTGEARHWYRRALDLQGGSLPAGHPETATTHLAMGRTYQRDQQPDSARYHYERVMDLLDVMRRNFTAATTRQYHLEDQYAAFEAALETLPADRLASAERAFSYLERSKANLLRDALNQVRAASFAGIPDSLLERDRSLKAQIAHYEQRKYERSGLAADTDSLLLQYNERLFELRQAHQRLIQLFATTYPDYYRLRYEAQPISAASVQAALAADEAFVEYFVGNHAIYVLLIRREDIQLKVLPKDFPLEDWTRELRRGLLAYFQSANPTEALYDQCNAWLVTNAYRLHQKLIAPLGPLPRRLIIVPDGVLAYIPFEILLSERPAADHRYASHHYLIKDHVISYNFSATLWHEMRNQTASAGDALILAPSFPQRDSSPQLPPLTYNREEGLAIRELTGGRLLLDEAATLAQFRELAPSAGILHLATHAQVDDRAVDFSFLALAGTGDAIPYDRLFIRDLYAMQLPAQLVVLSACQTGDGELHQGEGIISLGRAFAYAGARSLVTSLWSANDRSTAILMEQFYQHLNAGLPKDEALQRAKWAYLQQRGDPLAAHPFYWAAFIGLGDQEPISPSPTLPWQRMLIGLLALSGLVLFWRIVNI